MLENPTGRMIRCPECFAKDIDVFLHYDAGKMEFYCCKCCFTGDIERVDRNMKHFISEKYPARF